jgi:hypothetical protein
MLRDLSRVEHITRLPSAYTKIYTVLPITVGLKGDPRFQDYKGADESTESISRAAGVETIGTHTDATDVSVGPANAGTGFTATSVSEEHAPSEGTSIERISGDSLLNEASFRELQAITACALQVSLRGHYNALILS